MQNAQEAVNANKGAGDATQEKEIAAETQPGPERGSEQGSKPLPEISKKSFAKPTRMKKKPKSNYQFLVIDDQGLMRAILKKMLIDLGYEKTDAVESASSALSHMERKYYDAVFCDWEMPNMSGIELLKEVRSIEKYKNLVFFMVTGLDNTENIKEAIVAGVNDYIVKPINGALLANKLDSISK